MPAAGLYGRKIPDLSRPAIAFGDILAEAAPAHPAAFDPLGRLSGWQMLGNDIKGDCVAVTWANTRRLVTAWLGSEEYPDQAQVDAVYATQNPGGSDNGMNIQELLGYLHKTGGPDGAGAVAFAKVDHRRVSEVKAAIAIFGSVWTGINVLQSNEQQFGEGKPWDWEPHGLFAGGHSVITGGYAPARSAAGQLGGVERFITWAQETSFTSQYWAHAAEECWVVIWPEHLDTAAFTEGVSGDALKRAYQQITGRPLAF